MNKLLITGVAIHFLIPLIGLLTYVMLIRKMKKGKINTPPMIEFFFIFATYGALLILILTVLFWSWSGMASLGMGYLILGGPIVMGVITHRTSKNKQLSKYHLWTYRLGLLYFLITPLTFLLLVLAE